MSGFEIVILVVYVFMVGIQPYLLNKEKKTFWAGVIILTLEVTTIIFVSEWLIVLYFLAIPFTFTISLKASAGVSAFSSNKATTQNI